MNGKNWHVEHADCIEHMAEMPAALVDFAVFSPPFPSLFAYTSEMADIGNSENLRSEAKLHLSFFYRQLARVLKPGRVAVVHVMQIPGLARAGEKGIFDFRGMNIRLGQRVGLTYEYDWLVRKNPQAQAIRTHSSALLFVSLTRDRAVTRGCLGDYLIKFTAPGENAVPIKSDEITRNQWIRWAEPVWGDINETDTLNMRGTKAGDDTKHICPLQLEVIRRLVLLYTNPDEIVFSPFAGIGSEGWEAIKRGRRFYGIELKPEYHAIACRNLERCEKSQEEQKLLFALD